METSGVQSNNVTLRFHEPPRFDVNDKAQAEAMLKFLQENGYAVVASVASDKEIEQAKSLFWDFGEEVSHDLKRDDAATWVDENWIASARNGVIFRQKSEHSNLAWYTRMLPKVKKAFQLIWDTDQLVVSFDRVNAFRPWKHNPSWKTVSNWWHLDQNSLLGEHRRGRVCVQGLVTFTDADQNSGGLCIIPGSQHRHEEICQRTKAAHKSPSDFFEVDIDDPVMQKGGILLGARAGDLILWDSRVIHCNTPALDVQTDATRVHACTAPSTTAADNGSMGQGCTEMSCPPEGHDQASSTTPSEPETAATQNEASTSAAAEGEKVQAELLRLAAYVCMIPRERLSDTVREERKTAFQYGVGKATHWADVPLLSFLNKKEKKAIDSLGPVRDARRCPRAMLELVGYTDSDEELRHLGLDGQE